MRTSSQIVAGGQRDACGSLDSRDGLRALSEAKEHGLHTAATLDTQAEQFDRAEYCADSNQYIIDRSARLVRGMTWWGWFTNKFTTEPKPPEPRRTGRVQQSASEAPPRPLAREPAVVGPEVVVPIPSSHPKLREQQEYIDEVSRGLDDLLEVGTEIGRRAEEHNETVPRLHGKIEKLWQSTRHVTRQAGRVMESYATRATPQLLGRVALREVATRRFLRARGAVVALSNEIDCLRATCCFALYEKRANLLGLQSTVSRRYVGLTFSGAIKCSATSFGRCEEFDLDLTKSTDTPLLCVAANFGAGCWVRIEPKEGHLLPGEPRNAPDALQRAARFEIVFLDGTYEKPTFAEQILIPVTPGQPSCQDEPAPEPR